MGSKHEGNVMDEITHFIFILNIYIYKYSQEESLIGWEGTRDGDD